MWLLGWANNHVGWTHFDPAQTQKKKGGVVGPPVGLTRLSWIGLVLARPIWLG